MRRCRSRISVVENPLGRKNLDGFDTNSASANSSSGLDSVLSSATAAAGEVLGVRQNSGFVSGKRVRVVRLLGMVRGSGAGALRKVKISTVGKEGKEINLS